MALNELSLADYAGSAKRLLGIFFDKLSIHYKYKQSHQQLNTPEVKPSASCAELVLRAPRVCHLTGQTVNCRGRPACLPFCRMEGQSRIVGIAPTTAGRTPGRGQRKAV